MLDAMVGISKTPSCLLSLHLLTFLLFLLSSFPILHFSLEFSLSQKKIKNVSVNLLCPAPSNMVPILKRPPSNLSPFGGTGSSATDNCLHRVYISRLLLYSYKKKLEKNLHPHHDNAPGLPGLGLEN